MVSYRLHLYHGPNRVCFYLYCSFAFVSEDSTPPSQVTSHSPVLAAQMWRMNTYGGADG